MKSFCGVSGALSGASLDKLGAKSYFQFMDLRSDFLTQVWLPYPAMPQDLFSFGRIDELTSDSISLGGHKLFLSAKILLGPANKPILIEAVNLRLYLQALDLIGLRKENEMVSEVFLFAPCTAPPLSSMASVSLLQSWQLMLGKTREFFMQRQFLEIQTPTLVVCPGTEPFLDFFQTEYIFGRKQQTFFLPTSPELHLKKALHLGFNKIFEIRTCFRNGELSPLHQPEFFMLEWYRSFSDLKSIQLDLIELVCHLAEVFSAKLSLSPANFTYKSMADLFAEFCNFTLTTKTSIEDLQTLARKFGNPVDHFTDWDDVFFQIYVDVIEPKLTAYPFLFIQKYPPSQAAFARLTEDGWGDRFEFYINGIEIANAFHELNDPTIQRQRFAEDLQKKKVLGKPCPPLDADFLQALAAGMPPSGGIAVGLERIFMAFTGIADIRQTRIFPM